MGSPRRWCYRERRANREAVGRPATSTQRACRQVRPLARSARPTGARQAEGTAVSAPRRRPRTDRAKRERRGRCALSRHGSRRSSQPSRGRSERVPATAGPTPGPRRGSGPAPHRPSATRTRSGVKRIASLIRISTVRRTDFESPAMPQGFCSRRIAALSG